MVRKSKFSKSAGRRKSANHQRKSRRVERLEDRWVMAAPTLGEIANVTLIAGTTLNIALDGSDADNNPLTYSASSTGPITTFIPVGNDSMRLHVVQKNAQGTIINDFGIMEFELFEDLAPETAAHIKAYAANGDYNGKIFHRIIKNFMIQGGDDNGDGVGGIGGDGAEIDDEFNVESRFTSSGLLAMAKSLDDTNDSQFFITAGPTRHLDFNHTIFGFLTKGDSVRQAIANVPTDTTVAATTPGTADDDAAVDRPINKVEIQEATIFQDLENGVLRISAPVGTTGTHQVTVTVNDGTQSFQRTFNVTVVADAAADNGKPFLKDIDPINLTVGSTTTRVLQAVDAEGNSIAFYGDVPGSGVSWNYGTNGSTPIYYREVPTTGGVATSIVNLTATTPGRKTIGVFVLPTGLAPTEHQSAQRPPPGQQGSYTHSVIDHQSVEVNVSPNAPTEIDLLAESDAGASSTDNFTNRNNTAGNTLKFNVSGVWQGATVTLRIGDRVIGQATVPAAAAGQTPQLTSITITTNGAAGASLDEGANTITAIQSVDGLASLPSAALNVAVNAPPQLPPITNRTLDEETLVSFNVGATDPDVPTRETLTYAIVPQNGSPPGATIDSSGQFRWTPTESNGPGTFPVKVRVTDTFGVSVERDFTITVNEVNQAPVVQTPPIFEINAGEDVTYQVQATDVDEPSNTLTYSLTAGFPPGAAISSTGLFTFDTENTLAPGQYTATVIVNDGQPNGITQRTITINVQGGPVLEQQFDRIITEGEGFEHTIRVVPKMPKEHVDYELSVAEPDGQFIVDAFDPSTGAIILQTSEIHGPGVYTVTATARNLDGLEDTATFTITVLEANQNPVLDPIEDQEVDEGETLSLPVTATDPDLPANTLAYSLVGAVPPGLAISASTGVLTWTPGESAGGGQFTITVRVDDGQGGFDTDELVISVNETNSDPQLAPLPPLTAVQGSSADSDVTAADPDTPVQQLTFSLDDEAPSWVAIDSETGKLTWSPGLDVVPGVYSFQLTVDDGAGGTATQAVEITVTEPQVEPEEPEEEPSDIPSDLGEAGAFPGSPLGVPAATVNGSSLNNFSFFNNLPVAVNTIGQGLGVANPGAAPSLDVLAADDAQPIGARSYASPNHLGADTGVGSYWVPGLHTTNRPKTSDNGENSETDVEEQLPSAATEGQPVDERAEKPSDGLQRSAERREPGLNDAAANAVEIDARDRALNGLLSSSDAEQMPAVEIPATAALPKSAAKVESEVEASTLSNGDAASSADASPPTADAAAATAAAALSAGAWMPLLVTDVGRTTRDPGRLRIRRRPR